MLRTLRGPLGWALTAVMVFAACGGGTGAPSPQTTQGAQATSNEPRLGSFNRPIVMAFTPSQDVQRLTTSGNAIASALGQATGLAWKVSIPTSYAAQIESMCAGQSDVAFIAPLQMTLLIDKNCGTPVLAALRNDETRKLSTTYNSQILVRTDSGINDLAGLKGKKFAFTDTLSASGYVFPTLTVKNKTGQDPKTFFSQIIYAGGHDKAALAVYSGQVDGAATFIDVRTNAGMPADIMEKTKLIDRAGPIPNDGVALRKGFPDELGKQVTKALVDYGKTDAGKAALRSLFSWDGMQEVDAKFYDPMREAAKLAGIDVAAEAAKTARPVATPAPSPTKAP
ncbi:MAG TPA: phosphate/phosphite/phosphonate ABC transporter substrate-binding protein [Candidatus Limnocylindria bacterium]|nr:phosphate/phosphite/phosphonate ABC transporter substrate-binding protein [Candidatus Limnocylindria bacterium]